MTVVELLFVEENDFCLHIWKLGGLVLTFFDFGTVFPEVGRGLGLLSQAFKLCVIVGWNIQNQPGS